MLCVQRLFPFGLLPFCHFFFLLSRFRYFKCHCCCKILLAISCRVLVGILSRSVLTSSLPLAHAYVHSQYFTYVFVLFLIFFFSLSLLFRFIYISFFVSLLFDYFQFDVWNKLKEDEYKRVGMHLFLIHFCTHKACMEKKMSRKEISTEIYKKKKNTVVSSRIVFISFCFFFAVKTLRSSSLCVKHRHRIYDKIYAHWTRLHILRFAPFCNSFIILESAVFNSSFLFIWFKCDLTFRL